MTDIGLDRQDLRVGRDLRITGNPALWGIALFILMELALFGFIFFSYYYVAVQPRTTPWPGGPPDFTFSAINSGILIVSGFTAYAASWGVRRGHWLAQILGLAATLLLGLAYLGLEFWDWATASYVPSLFTDSYASQFFMVSGFHVAHIIVGLLILLALLVWSLMGYYGPGRATPILIGVLYWYFVIAVWLAVFFTLYGTPYLGLRHG